MVHGLLFCDTLTGRRGGHTLFVQAGAEMSHASADPVKPDRSSSWEGHNGVVRLSARDDYAASCRVVRPLRIPIGDPPTAQHIC